VPFTDPQTVHNPSAGVVAPSAWGDTVRGSLVFLSSPPRGVVEHNTTHNHNSSGNWIAAQANTELKDTDGCHDTVTNNSRVTIVTPGDYLFEASIEIGTSATGSRALKFMKNATTDFETGRAGAANVSHWAAGSALVHGLIAGDYVECFAYQNSGGTLTMQLQRMTWLYVGT
jgi:hypothetical protein